MPFGKFKGHIIKNMLSSDNLEEFSLFGKGSPRSYLKWFNKTIKTHTLSKSISRLLNKRELEIQELQQEYQRKNPRKSYNSGNADMDEAIYRHEMGDDMWTPWEFY